MPDDQIQYIIYVFFKLIQYIINETEMDGLLLLIRCLSFSFTCQ